MTRHRVELAFIVLVAAALACTVPGASGPTPFAFPTPNMTLTAIFAPTGTVGATGQPTPESTSTVLVGATETPAPTATPIVNDDVRPNGRPVAAPQMASAPTIDGDLNDWPSDRMSISEVVYGSDHWTGGSDLSALYAIGWDSDNLYLAVQVSDDTFVQVATGSSIFKGDSIEILLDTALAADFNSTVLSGDDYQVGISPGDMDGKSPEAYRWFPRSARASLTSVQAAVGATGSGYILEARVPWIVFGLQPAAGDSYGFALSVSDDDQAGTAEQQSMVSSVRTRVLTNPTTWGTLQLSGGG